MGLSQFGLLKSVKKCCSDQINNDELQANLSNPFTKKKLIIHQDYKRFQKQTWFRFQKCLSFDPKKFIFLYNNYDEQQTKLIKHWKNIDMKNAQFGRIGNPDDVRSQRWKFAIRRGVPIIYYKSIISVIFNRNFEILNVKTNYQKLLIEHKIDQNKFQNNILFFGLKSTNLKEAVFAPFFNKQGYKSLSNILRLLQRIKGGRLTYNPYICHLIPLFLIFFSQDQTYDLISIMLDGSTNTSQKRMQSLRWHFIFKEQQLQSIAQSFYIFIGSKSGTVKKLNKHFDTYKIDKIKIFKNIIEDFFYSVLPFKVILRIFILFLNQGMIFLFRLFYSLFKGCETLLYQCQSTQKCLNIIRKRWILCQDIQYDQLLKTAYNIVLDKYINTKIQQSFIQNKQKIVYYLPYIKNSSQILNFDDVLIDNLIVFFNIQLQTIWDYLPVQLQHYDVEKTFPLLYYCQQNKQKKFNDMIQVLDNDLSFIVIKTVTDVVFGVFFARAIVKGKQGYMGHSENFVFQLEPNKIKYASSGENVYYLLLKKDCLEIGGGGYGPAIRIKSDMVGGESYKSDTYMNQPLHNCRTTEFKIKQIEVFQLY